MLKKILILGLTLNTAYILPASSSLNPGLGCRLVLGCIGSASGIGGTWLAYKNFKDFRLTIKEIQHHSKILSEMGIKQDFAQLRKSLGFY